MLSLNIRYRLPQIVELKSTIALIVVSSGSTGLPKCVPFTHAMALECFLTAPHSDDGTIIFHPVPPLCTISAMEITSCIFYRSPRIITAEPLTVDHLFNVLQKHKVNEACLLPFTITAMAKHMLTENYDLSNLTKIITTGAKLTEDTQRILSEKLPNIDVVIGYGLVDVGGALTISSSKGKCKIGSVGYLVAGASMKVRSRIIVMCST